MQRSPLPHTVPHAPQSFWSSFVSTHLPEQLVLPAGHGDTQTPSWQCAPAPIQAVVQSPQCAGSFETSTQAPPHATSAAVQVKSQLPAVQRGEPPVGALQTREQAPQFELSFARSAQEPSQSVVPAEQSVTQSPSLQTCSLSQLV